MLFDWNLSRHPFLKEVVDLDPLLCTGFAREHADLFCSPILLRSNNDQKFELSDEHCIGR